MSGWALAAFDDMDVATSNKLKEHIETGRRERLRSDRAAALAAFQAAAAIDPLNAAVKIELAKELRALDRLDEAKVLLDGVLDAEPGQVSALIERGHLLRRQGDRQGAATAFEAAAKVEPKNRNIQVELTRDLRALGRLDEAGAVVDAILELEPGHVGALIERGHICRRRGDHAGALAAFKAAAAADPQNRNIQVELARDLRTLGRLDEADKVLDSVLNAEPGKIGALVERGHIRRRKGDYEGAATAFKAAAKADPHNLNIQVELVRDLRALSRFDEADAVLGSVLDAEPRQFGALIERGHIQRGRGDFAAALNSYESAATVDPSSSGLQLEIATALRALGRLSAAEDVLRKVTEADPGHLAAIVRLGHLLMEANRLDDADALLTRATQTTPNDYRIIAALGHLARRRGDGAAALRYFKSATEAEPANLDLKLDLAAELREQGRLDDAFPLLQSVVDIDPNHWAGWMQLGQYYRAKDDPQSAMGAFQTAVMKQPRQTQGLVDLAQENWAAGNAKEAETLLHRALEQEPGHLGALLVSAEKALQTERPGEAYEFARRAIQYHPGQLGGYLIAARAAAYDLNLTRPSIFWIKLVGFSGQCPTSPRRKFTFSDTFEITIRIRSLIDNTSEEANANFSFWVESTSFSITTGDFERADRMLGLAPAKSSRELARVQFLRAHMAEGLRQYANAVAHYQEALSLDPRNGGWHGEMARAYLLLADTKGVRDHLKASFTVDLATKVAAGHSLNISQHHTGQLLDEFLMEPDLIVRLGEASALPITEQLKTLHQLARDNPDHTAPAIMLLSAMRQSGILTIGQQTSAPDETPKIPQTIIQFWNDKNVPRDIGDLIASWRDKNNGYEHLLFNDVSAANYLANNYSNEVNMAFRRAREPAQRADIFRLAYLAQQGGIYIDIDDLCLTKLRDFVPAYAEFVGYQENYATIANNFLGAIPRHPVIVRALRLAVEAVNRGDHDIVWLSTGPGLLTRAFAQTASDATYADWPKKTAILELYEAQRWIGLHCPAAYKQTDKHWSRAAFRRRVNGSAKLGADR